MSKSKKSTAVKDHMLFCDHIVCDHFLLSIDDFKILATSDSDFHGKESLFNIMWWTHRKKHEKSVPLLPIWVVPPIRNYILMIFVIVTVIVLI